GATPCTARTFAHTPRPPRTVPIPSLMSLLVHPAGHKLTITSPAVASKILIANSFLPCLIRRVNFPCPVRCHRAFIACGVVRHCAVQGISSTPALGFYWLQTCGRLVPYTEKNIPFARPGEKILPKMIDELNECWMWATG